MIRDISMMCTHSSMHDISPRPGKTAQPIHPTGNGTRHATATEDWARCLVPAICFSLLCTLGASATLRFKSKHSGKSEQGLRANIPHLVPL